jgi:hypothetical protein
MATTSCRSGDDGERREYESRRIARRGNKRAMDHDLQVVVVGIKGSRLSEEDIVFPVWIPSNCTYTINCH